MLTPFSSHSGASAREPSGTGSSLDSVAAFAVPTANVGTATASAINARVLRDSPILFSPSG